MEESTNPALLQVLASLTELVHQYLLPKRKTKGSGKDPGHVKDTLHLEVERIKQALLLVRMSKQVDCGYQVRRVQQTLMELINAVVARGGAQEIQRAREKHGIYRCSPASHLFEELEGLLEYIEHHYPKQFDYGIPLCDGQREVWKEKISNELEAIFRWFREEELSEYLREIVIGPFCEVIMPERFPLLTYREWQYLRDLWSQLLGLTRTQAADTEEALLQVLIRNNFNRDQCLDYCMQYISTELARSESAEEEYVVRTKHYRRLIMKARPTRKIALLPENEALHARLMTWIDDNYACYQTMTSVNVKSLEDRVPQKDMPRKERLETSPSVDKIGGFFKLLFLCKFFRETNASEITRHIAARFSTACAKAPSWGSIKAAFDVPSEAALRYAYDLCHEILRQIDAIRKGEQN
jgi:hypothetical protein